MRTLLCLVTATFVKLPAQSFWRINGSRRRFAFGICGMGNIAPEKQAELPYSVQTEGYRVWLLGDSVIDNSYWNGVEENATPEVLKRLLPGIEVKDRSTEELDALSLLRLCRDGRCFRVGAHYVEHRTKIGIPYDPPSGLVDVSPDFGPKDIVVLSIGGNDFALRGEMNPTVILGLVRELVKFYVGRGVRPERVFYISPYPPTFVMKAFTFVAARKNLDSLYRQYLQESDQLCEEEGITHIPLNHFSRKERADPGTLIPEPTPEGAHSLAVLIQRAVLKQIQKEESGIARNPN